MKGVSLMVGLLLVVAAVCAVAGALYISFTILASLFTIYTGYVLYQWKEYKG